MSSMSPGERLTQPDVQGIVERGSFFHSVHAFEWYLSLEPWLPLLLLLSLKLAYSKPFRYSQPTFVSQSGL